ncbi:hypothetical protein ACI394_27935, partial [Klebsiella pneumoniae]|uniref:hypothetical protein n=1 Tax=Klebsiella pneumoniae TaxID=573 RepID=UPI003854BDA9
KHTRRLRYQRQFARRSRGSECVLSRNLPRHRKAKPAAQLRAPMGEDSATLHWQANLRTMLDMQHPKNIRVRYSIGGTPTFYRE